MRQVIHFAGVRRFGEAKLIARRNAEMESRHEPSQLGQINEYLLVLHTLVLRLGWNSRPGQIVVVPTLKRPTLLLL